MEFDRPDTGLVYIIGEEAQVPETVKIGWTSNLAKRIKSLQTSMPSRLKIYRTIYGNIASEQWFHREFASRRLSGEWFKFADEMLTILPPCQIIDPEEPEKPEKVSNGLVGRAEDPNQHFDYLQKKWVAGRRGPGTVPIGSRHVRAPASIMVEPGEGLIINGSTLTFCGWTTIAISGTVDVTISYLDEEAG
jgi:hypothetical protein